MASRMGQIAAHLCAGSPAATGAGHPHVGTHTSHAVPVGKLAQEAQDVLPAACCHAAPGSPAEVGRSRFLPQTPLGVRVLLAELPMHTRAGTTGGDLAEAAIPQHGSASGREGIKERRSRHLLTLPAVTPPRWQGARSLAPGLAALCRAGSEHRDEGRMLVEMLIPAGDCHHVSS